MASAKTTQVLGDAAPLLIPEPSTSQFIWELLSFTCSRTAATAFIAMSFSS